MSDEVQKKLSDIADKADRVKETIRRGGKINEKAEEHIKKATEQIKEAADEVDRVNGGKE